MIASKIISPPDKDFSRLELGLIHKPMIAKIGEVLGKFLPLPQMALTGFCWTALRIYQMDHQITVKWIGELSPDHRIAIVADIFKILANQLKDALSVTIDTPLIDTAVLEAFNFYQQFYGYR